MFVFGVDATRTPVDDDICIEGGATGLDDELVSRDPPRVVARFSFVCFFWNSLNP